MCTDNDTEKGREKKNTYSNDADDKPEPLNRSSSFSPLVSVVAQLTLLTRLSLNSSSVSSKVRRVFEVKPASTALSKNGCVKRDVVSGRRATSLVKHNAMKSLNAEDH